MKKNILYIIISIFCIFGFTNNVCASSSLSVSTTSTTVGNTIKVTATVSNVAAWNLSITASGPVSYTGGTLKEVGDTGTGKNGSKTITATYKATGTGTANFYVTGDAYNQNMVGETISSSRSVSIKAARALETNNYLSNLTVEGYELAPSFNKETDNYIVDIEPGITSIKVTATKENRYASVSGDGEIEVTEGNNEISIIVVSESGSKRTYHLNAIVKEYDPIKVSINDSEFTVVRKISELTKPDGYEETTVQINDDIVPAFTNTTTGYTLVGLKDVTGAIKLYIYNKDNNTFTPYLALSFAKLDLIIIEAENSIIPKGFIQDTITINEETVTCYKNKELGITLIYGKSTITGENSFYSFENTDMTVQKFNFDMLNKINKKIELYSYVILGLGSLVLLILLIIIIVKVKGKKKLKNKKEEIEKTMKIDIEAIKEESKLSKKEIKRQEKLKKKELEEQTELLRQKEESLKQAEIEKEKFQAKENKKLQKKEKKNKNKPEKFDDMFKL